MIEFMEVYLRRRSRQSNQEIYYVDVVAKSMLAYVGINHPINGFARQAFLGPRQFHRKFPDCAGVSAKFFMCIVRFWTA